MNSPQKRKPLARKDLPGGLWSTTHIFRHGQCDPAGIVYTPEFFNVFNQHIEAWFDECLNLNYYDFLGERRTGLGYVDVQATFFTPCTMGEEIEVFIRIVRIGGTSYTLQLHAMKAQDEALRGNFTTVATNLDLHRPIAIPQDLRDALQNYYDSTTT